MICATLLILKIIKNKCKKIWIIKRLSLSLLNKQIKSYIMNDIAKLKSLISEVKDIDRPKFDRVYNEVLYPRMVNMAEKWKKNELSIGSYQNDDTHNKVVKELFENSNLQSLVETKMKPYLEEKGFKVVICSPSYYVYIRW